MARALRSLEPGGIYHVILRGVNGETIFVTTADRLHFLTLLGRAVGRYGWSCQSYCLLGNHLHLLVQTPEPNLSRGMHWLNGAYAQSFNRKHQRYGHLLADRFTAVAVLTDGHLLKVTRYIAMNPVEAGLCPRPQDWEWSSYGATIGCRPPVSFLDREALLERFGRTPAVAIRALRAFVEET
jgi:REP-associated tyrosine transposase